MSSKNVLQVCQVRSVKEECFTRVSSKSVSKINDGASHKSVK